MKKIKNIKRLLVMMVFLLSLGFSADAQQNIMLSSDNAISNIKTLIQNEELDNYPIGSVKESTFSNSEASINTRVNYVERVSARKLLDLIQKNGNNRTNVDEVFEGAFESLNLTDDRLNAIKDNLNTLITQ